MKYFMVLCLSFVVVVSNSQDALVDWSLVKNDHIKSFGEECSIMVSSEFEVVRDVILIEPSFESLLYKAMSNDSLDVKNILLDKEGKKKKWKQIFSFELKPNNSKK